MDTKYLTMLVAVAGITIGAAVLRAQQQDASTQLRTLRKERLDTLRLVVDFAKRRNAQGTADVLDVLNAEHQLLDAESESSLTNQQRAVLLQKLVDNREAVELVLARRHESSGVVTAEDVLRAKADRLDAMIRLLEFKVTSVVAP